MQTTKETIERFGRLVEAELLKRNESTSSVVSPLSDAEMKQLAERIFLELAPPSKDEDEKTNRENYESICILLDENFLARYDDGVIQCHDLESLEKIQNVVNLLKKHIPEIGDVISVVEQQIPPSVFAYDPKTIYVVDENDEDITARNYAAFFKRNVCIHGPSDLTSFLDNHVDVFFKTASAFGIPWDIARKRFVEFVADLKPETTATKETVMNVIMTIWDKMENPRHALRVIQNNALIVSDFSRKLEQFYPNKHPKPVRLISASGSAKHVSDGEVSSPKRLRVDN